MAGDWIKMRIELLTHPKVVRILSAIRPHDVQTKTDKFRAIGGLHAVWSVFDTHSEDGCLVGFTPETLDLTIGWEGFSQAMIAVGWMAWDGEETLTLPEFGEHNGQSAKRRAEDTKRKKHSRKSCPQNVRKMSAEVPDKMRTREEKRREDKEAIQEVLPDWLPAARWQDFVEHRKAIKAPMTERARAGMLKHLDKLHAAGHDVFALMETAIRSGWKDVYEPKPAGQFNSPAVPAHISTPGGGRRELGS